MEYFNLGVNEIHICPDAELYIQVMSNGSIEVLYNIYKYLEKQYQFKNNQISQQINLSTMHTLK